MKAILLADTKVSTSIQSSIYFEKDWIVFNWCPSTFMSIGWYHIFTLNLFVFGKKCCVFMLVHNKYISVNDISYLIHTILLILYTKPIVYCLFHFIKLLYYQSNLSSGNVIGYHVTQACFNCLNACNNGHFWIFGSDGVKGKEMSIDGQLVNWGLIDRHQHIFTFPTYNASCRWHSLLSMMTLIFMSKLIHLMTCIWNRVVFYRSKKKTQVFI